jgi:hypothetical protein
MGGMTVLMARHAELNLGIIIYSMCFFQSEVLWTRKPRKLKYISEQAEGIFQYEISETFCIYFQVLFYSGYISTPIKDLVMNVYSDGKWGSYRHLPLDSCATVTVPHAYVSIMTRGDFSSFRWLEGNLDPDRCWSTLVHSNVITLKFHYSDEGPE